MIKKMMFFVPALSFGAANEYDALLKNAFYSYFGYINSMMFILALLPVVVMVIAYMSAKKHIKKVAQEQGRYSQPHIEMVGLYFVYVLGSAFALFLIYGGFATIYAGVDSFGEAWQRLVVDFWRAIFQFSPTSNDGWN